MRTIVCVLTSIFTLGVSTEAWAALAVDRLRWDGRGDAFGIYKQEPRIGWAVRGSVRGAQQSAYHVLVASTPERLVPGRADLWDSGKIASADSVNVRYAGPPLQARQRGYFTIRVWDERDRPSPWAQPVSWEMMLGDEDWEAQWIGRPLDETRAPHRSVTLLRKTFAITEPVRRARLYASALGAYELTVNGRAVSDRVMPPGYTNVEQRVLAQTYDVTRQIVVGDNAIGVVLGGAWCTAALGGRTPACGDAAPRFAGQLEIELADGKRYVVLTDNSWLARGAPTTSSHLWDGEEHDARLEQPGWDRASFSARGWTAAGLYDVTKERTLTDDPSPPVQVLETLRPGRMTEPRPGVYVFDLGRNIVGRVRLSAKGPAGTVLTLRHAEALERDGTLYTANLRAARATDRYTKRSARTEVWEPRFTLHGFRYVELTGAVVRPALADVQGRVMGAAFARTGWLATSEPRLDRLFENAVASTRAAFISVPATGPQRDERVAWSLDAQAFASTACLLLDVQGFQRKWIEDVRGSQDGEGGYATTAPPLDPRSGVPGNADAGIVVPWAQTLCYADYDAIAAHSTSMVRFVDQGRRVSRNGIVVPLTGMRVDDPMEATPGTDPAMIATASLAYDAMVLASMLRFLGPAMAPYAKQQDGTFVAVRDAFARRFVAADGRIASDTQTAYALALRFGLVPDVQRQAVARAFVRAVERAEGHATTGILGSAHLLPALTQIGRDDLAYRLLLEARCPSWTCTVDHGATTMWQRMDGWTVERGFADAATNSFNHYAQGAVAQWMLERIGGIALDPTQPGGKHVFVRPMPGGGLTSARARYDSLHGPIETHWRQERGRLSLEVSIPANTHATVTLPGAGQASEGSRPLDGAPGIEVVSRTPTDTTVRVTSGRYRFALVQGR